MNLVNKLIRKVTGKRTGRIKLKWEFKTNSNIFSDPCISDINNDGKQEIIVPTKNGTIYVLNDEGKVLWHYKIFENISQTKQLFREESTLNAIYGKPVT